MRWPPGTISARGRTVHTGRCTGPSTADKDQSYFLFATTQEQIDYVRFPLGNLSKAQTRALAQDMGLVVADKAESQDICFVPQGKYSDIISRLRPEAAHGGDIVHIDGRVLGHHDGIVHYTIGQRRGLGVATGAPLYVVHLDAASARVIVGPREALDTHRLHLRDINWLGDGPVSALPKDGLACFAKVRSTRPPGPATAWWHDGTLVVALTDGEAGIAPGQACVLYSSDGDDARVYGGGFIDRTERTAEAEARLRALLSGPETAELQG